MKRIFLYFLPVMFIISCTVEKNQDTNAVVSEVEEPQSINSTFSVDLSENEELKYENLRVLPIIASEEFVENNKTLSKVKTLDEGIKTKGFYITEKKPFGANDDQNAVNNLTVQNKSNETIYLMQGDVVTGGNQDRVIAENVVVPPRTIRDISVFCVEKNRWKYKYEGEDEEGEAKKKQGLYAFSGYYNVASTSVRKTARTSNNQMAVWNAVGEMTKKHNATTSTKTYRGLEGSKEFTHERTGDIRFFDGKFDEIENCVGFVVVSGNKVLGTEVFGHPDLFKKQYKPLLHSYISEAMTSGSAPIVSEKTLESFSKRLNREIKNADTKELYKFNDEIVHYSRL